MAKLSPQANLEQKLGIKKDVFYKLQGFNQPQKGSNIDIRGSYTLRESTLNTIAGLMLNCTNWNELTQLYPIPDNSDFANIEITHYGRLPNSYRDLIRTAVNDAFKNIPPVFKPTTDPSLPPQALPTFKEIPAFTGYFLLLFYVKEDRQFRVLPLKIWGSCEVEMRRFSDLSLYGRLEKRGSNCFVHLKNADHPNTDYPNPNPFSFITNTPENTNAPLSSFTVTLLTARSNRSATRNGVGLCKRITEEQYQTFVMRDYFSEARIKQFSCNITAGDIYHLRKYYIYEYDHSLSQPTNDRDLIDLHNANFFGYFRRSSKENSIIKLPVSISNGFMLMNHTYERIEYEGVLTFKPPVLWVRMRTINNGINFSEEYFVIQLQLNGNSLRNIAINDTISGLYIATRSKDSIPICGQFILERANFDYQNTKGEILPLDNISNPLIRELLFIEG